MPSAGDRTTSSISLAQARRIALAAQGFGEARPTGRVDRRHLRRVLDRVGLIQIDSVNVLVRSQELPLWSRLGAHPRSLIHDATHAGELFEYWVHEAAHVPTEHFHLWRWKMGGDHKWKHIRELRQRRPDYIDEVYRRIEAEGPMTSGEFEARVGPKGTWWDWDDAKVALEHLFWTGQVTARRRPNDFARVYDLTHRVLPTHVLERPALAEDDARKELLLLAAKHHGVGTLDDLADYHRQLPTRVKPLVDELVEDGRLVPVAVEGWKKPAYLHPEAKVPRRLHVPGSVVSMFDPVVWYRPRAERLFDFHYRIEIYTPAPKRVFGYYVLPFLWGDSVVGRLDLKADRHAGALLVPGVFGEAAITDGRVADVADAMARELHDLATWLGLDRVVVGDRGDLALPVRHAVDRYARA